MISLGLLDRDNLGDYFLVINTHTHGREINKRKERGNGMGAG